MNSENNIYETLALGMYHRFCSIDSNLSPIESNGKETPITRNKDTYLAQVKCYNPTDKIKYEPISILHSNIIKRNAVGGYFVTTSDYNENAKKYAEGLNIKLINGFELAQYWLGEKESWIHESQNKTHLEELFSSIEGFFKEIYNTIVKKVK